MNAKIRYFLYMNIFEYEKTSLWKYDKIKFTLKLRLNRDIKQIKRQ